MEEHYQAYFAWKEQRIQGAWCWHVDAHLDIGELGLTPERLALLKDSPSAHQAASRQCLGCSYLPWGGLHCGNYLYPAIREGIVGRLTWVIPPDLPETELLSWARAHLNEWFELSPQEFAGLRLDGERVVGELLGIPFEVGPLHALRPPREPVLLDIDLDYFLHEDGTPWQRSEEFASSIREVPCLMTTVAYSVKGGFTPERERTLVAPWLTGDNVQIVGEPCYREQALDRTAALVRCHRYEEALAELEERDPSDLRAAYLRGIALHALKRYEDTLDQWENILTSPSLPSDGTAYLLNLCSELALTVNQPELALDYSLRAQKLDRSAYQPCWNEAQAREALGQEDKSVKALRKTAKLAAGRLFELKARNALMRLYRRQGKDGPAQAEAQRLHLLDPSGRVQGFALLGIS